MDADAQVAWIDTEGTFRGDRVRNICDRFNLDQDCVLENIVVCRTFTHEMLEGAVVAIAAKMSEVRRCRLTSHRMVDPARVLKVSGFFFLLMRT